MAAERVAARQIVAPAGAAGLRLIIFFLVYFAVAGLRGIRKRLRLFHFGNLSVHDFQDADKRV